MDQATTILIIYAEQDDQPIEGGYEGWVTHFHKYFSTLLGQIDPTEISIELVASKELSQAHLDKAAAVLALETLHFLNDQSAIDLIRGWVVKHIEAKTLFKDDAGRFLRIHKSPSDPTETLPELKELIPYDFYYVDQVTGKPEEFTRFFGSDAERVYWMKMIDVAYDVSHVLHASTTAKQPKKSTSRDKTVYLASTGRDIMTHRDVIKRELKRHGYEVLPKYALPTDKDEMEKKVREDLKASRLSIHLIGEDYGVRPPGSDLSIVDIENQLAHEHTGQMVEVNEKTDKKKPFSRLIWVSPDLKNITERQKIFIEDIKTVASMYEEAEVLQIELEEMKGIILEELETGGRFDTHRQVEGYETPDDSKSKIIYLISDKSDVKGSKKVADYLIKQGYQVVSPAFDGNLIDIRYIHQENLRRCDGSIVYMGNATAAWMKTKLQDLMKAPGFGREKPLRAKAVYIEKESTVDLPELEKDKALVLGNNGDFKPEHLKPFLTKLDE